uniref:Uncharacterized protein n=1 Tax=Moniliophthora roreri TaxID=221103 RepID=A0A0W0EVK4_MONRR
MYFPLISSRSAALERRKGGGGGGGGGGGRGGGSTGGRSGGSSGGSNGGSSGSRGGSTGGRGSTGGGTTGSGSRSSPISFGGTSQSASTSSRGGGTPFSIPSGQIFAGRQVGGGTRDQIFGSRGYPGVAGRGVAGRGFPFYFWPVAWGGAAGGGTAAYLHNREYGHPDNSSRPGGPMFTTSLSSNTSATNRSTFHLIADNTTVVTLADIIDERCASFLASTNSSTPFPFYENATNVPKPESAIQYYRASSVVLTLEGYNNSAVFSEDENVQDSPLPNNVDTGLLDCLNKTIGENVPLVAAPVLTNSGGSVNGVLGVSVNECSTLVLVFVLGHLVSQATL